MGEVDEEEEEHQDRLKEITRISNSNKDVK